MLSFVFKVLLSDQTALMLDFTGQQERFRILEYPVVM